MDFVSEFEKRCLDAGYKITRQRLTVAEEIARSNDHPTAEMLYERIQRHSPDLSFASIYRTLSVMDKLGLILRHDFGDGKARIEPSDDGHHNHLINIENGDIVEIDGDRMAEVQRKVAQELGYELVDYKLELYAKPLGENALSPEARQKLVKRRRARA